MFNKILALGVCAVLPACADLSTTPDRQPAALAVRPDTIVATAGQSFSPEVTVLDQDGEPFEQVPGWVNPLWEFGNAGMVTAEGSTLTPLTPGAVTGIVTAAGVTARTRILINPRELQVTFDGFYITQGTQRLDHSVPLVAGRDALLRVFLHGDRPNFFRPQVRATLYRDGSPVRTISLERSERTIPQELREGELNRSWNAVLPGSVIQPGLSLVLEADPAGTIPLAVNSSVRHPAEGTHPLNVQEVPPFYLTIVPIRQSRLGTTGRVHAGNLGALTSELIGMHPIAEHHIRIREPYTTSAAALDARGWSTIIREVAALRLADRSGHYYYGLLTPPRGTPYAGLGYLGYPVAIGIDEQPDAAGTLAHELGHNFDRGHSPCGGPAGVDPEYPYRDGSIGAFGYSRAAGTLQDPTTVKDMMSYCRPRWTSDYTFRKVLEFRRAGDGGTFGGEAAGAERALLVWGSIEDGRAVVEPAFELPMRPKLPEGAGTYRLEGFDAAGARIFSYGFEGEAVDHRSDDRHFAFAIPAGIARPERLAEIRVTGGGIAPRSRRSASAPVMAMVRDARSGRVLAFARGADAIAAASRPGAEVHLSDGVRSSRSIDRIR